MKPPGAGVGAGAAPNVKPPAGAGVDAAAANKVPWRTAVAGVVVPPRLKETAGAGAPNAGAPNAGAPKAGVGAAAPMGVGAPKLKLAMSRECQARPSQLCCETHGSDWCMFIENSLLQLG
jgi:hypothetical protein